MGNCRMGGSARFAGRRLEVVVDTCTGWLFVCALLADGRLPEAWMPPEHVRQWLQRLRATLYQHGVDGMLDKLRRADGRALLQRLQFPADAREPIKIALAVIDATDAQVAPLERELRQLPAP